MEALFSEFTVKHLRLPNRIVMPSLASFLTGEGGSISEETVEHYRRRAGGGPAMVIIEACAVSPEGVVSPNQTRICDDRHVEGLAKIAAAIAAEGCIPAIQLHHAGRQTSSRVIGRPPLAPSDLPCPTISGEVEPLTVEGIQRLVKKFGDAAMRARQAGFKLIEIHGAHGYLVNQFLSGFSNVRQDAYGGDTARRTRFAREIVTEVRRRIGDAFPLSFKISAEEHVEGGLTTAESIEILKLLVAAGVDLVQVSAGNDATSEWICQPMFMPKACLVASAAAIKQVLDVPVMAVGRINDPHTADRIIASGQADLVCMGRGLLADPELPRKAREGRFDEIRTCIACNTCMQSIFKRGRIECLVNPTLGREKEMALVPAANPRRVVVVGGGPAGLNLAWVAAKRGHEVHLFEQRDELGGQLVPGSRPQHKAELRSLIRFQRRQAELNGVRCHLSRRVTVEDIRALDPQVVVLATGALPVLPPVEGIGGANVLTYAEVLNGRPPLNQRIAVVGGGPTGLELALYCAENGCRVTVVEMLDRLGGGMEAMTRRLLLAHLKAHGVGLFTETRLEKVTSEGIWVSGKQDGGRRLIPADRVVIAVGTRPDNRLQQELASLDCEVHLIGDCVTPRNAKEAIYESAVLARKL